MSQELMSIIEQLEREKGIKKEVLIEAIESALATAVRKEIELKPEDELKVQLDADTGKIKAFKNNQEVTNIDFGRIATSTARQVIIQKIREAEKEVVLTEFQAKVGEIISGIVYRFDKGNIVIDLLGKAEGLLLRRDQSPKEEFKQGQRIRAYVYEVNKDSKGIKILLSRTHVNFIKKLFELEIPEIYEGIVEIKAISREAGVRTKIAVWSKNDKVDSVGACVGVRGNRIKNIVTELQGEKIDIVRFNDDSKEYIRAALSPAKIAEMKLNKESKRVEVIVDDDQLSLAIGKHGQNVRLASRLTGWELDIRTKEPKKEAVVVAQEKVEKVTEKTSGNKKKEKKEKKAPKQETISIENLSGVGEKTVSLLKKAGFSSIADIANSTIEALTQVKGIGEKKAQNLIEEAKKISGK